MLLTIFQVKNVIGDQLNEVASEKPLPLPNVSQPNKEEKPKDQWMFR